MCKILSTSLSSRGYWVTAGWITLIGVAERNKRQKEACLPSRSLHLVGEGRQDSTAASAVPGAAAQESASSSSREGDVKPVWLIRKMQGSTLEHVLCLSVIPRGTKDSLTLPGKPYGWSHGYRDPGMGNLKPHRQERFKIPRPPLSSQPCFLLLLLPPPIPYLLSFPFSFPFIFTCFWWWFLLLCFGLRLFLAAG